MARDIDYAATAVKTAVQQKFGRYGELDGLDVTAGERLILIRDDAKVAEGTRDDLLAVVRAADTYENLWERLTARDKPGA